MILDSQNLFPISYTAPKSIQTYNGLSAKGGDHRRVSPTLIVPSSESEDYPKERSAMTSVAKALPKMDAPKSDIEPLTAHASDDDDDEEEEEDSGGDPKLAGKKSSLKSRRELPPGAVSVLKQWLLSPEHFTHPYPTPQDQVMLMRKTGIDKKQLKNWFTNARRRIWKPMLKKQLEQGALLDTAAASNSALNHSSSEPISGQEAEPSAPTTEEIKSQQRQHETWQGQLQFGEASQGNHPLSSFTYVTQYPSSQQQIDQQQLCNINPCNSIGSLPQISSYGSAAQMLKTDSHAVLMELFARDQDLVRQAAKGAKLKAQAINAVQSLGQPSVLSGSNISVLQSTKTAQAASVPSMNSWPHFSSVSSLNNLGSLAAVKSIQNLSGADLASQANKKGSLPHIKSQENMVSYRHAFFICFKICVYPTHNIHCLNPIFIGASRLLCIFRSLLR
jgi:hypothetical protein